MTYKTRLTPHAYKLNEHVTFTPIGGGGLSFEAVICNRSRDYTKQPTYTLRHTNNTKHTQNPPHRTIHGKPIQSIEK